MRKDYLIRIVRGPKKHEKTSILSHSSADLWEDFDTEVLSKKHVFKPNS